MSSGAAPSAEQVAAQGAKVERLFQRVGVRMEGLGICNPALHVQVVGMRPYREFLVGVLIAPWTINLLLVQAPGGPALPRLPLGDKQRWSFPTGDFEFVGSTGGEADDPEGEVGPWQACSLMSPVTEVASQEAALALAGAVMQGLFTDTAPEPPAPPSPPAPPPAPPRDPRPSRRGFLTFGRSR